MDAPMVCEPISRVMPAQWAMASHPLDGFRE
jgi:hypothetical protein